MAVDIRMGGAGVLFGVLVAALFIGSANLTGFAVFAGETVVNIGETFSENTLVPLSTPEDVTRVTVTGTFEGSGTASIYLVEEDRTSHIASYTAPKAQNNVTYLLEAGGTVVQLFEENVVTYEHIFDHVCDETCEGEFKAPLYVQVSVDEGEFTLTSIEYVSPDIISIPETPSNETNISINVTEPPLPIVLTHENIPSDCSADADCGSGLVCHVGYCVTETGHLNVTDSTGRVVALFDKNGRILLAGEIYQKSIDAVPANAFTINNGVLDVAWVTDTGDLHLLGQIYEGAAQVPILGSDNFIIRNPTDNVVVVQGLTGDLYTVDYAVSSVLT